MRMGVFLKLTEGKRDGKQVQERVVRIQQLRETLRWETLKNGAVPEKRDPCDQVRHSRYVLPI